MSQSRGLAVACGLSMLGALLLLLLEPSRRRTWRFGKTNVICRWSWSGWGWSWKYPISHLARLEVRGWGTIEQLRGWPAFKKTLKSAQDEPEMLQWVLIDSQNICVCSIDDLTEAEARWIGDVILRARPEWLGLPSQADHPIKRVEVC